MAVEGKICRLVVTAEGGSGGVIYSNTSIYIRVRSYQSDDTLCSNLDISSVKILVYDKNTGTVLVGDGDKAYANSTGSATGQPVEDDTITFNTQTLTWKNTPSESSHVQIGANTDASYANMVTKINSVVFGMTGSYTGGTLTVKAQHYGETWNLTSGLSEATTNFTWNSANLSGGALGVDAAAAEADTGYLVSAAAMVITNPTLYGAGESEPVMIRVEVKNTHGYFSVAEIEIALVGRSTEISDAT